MAPVAPVSLPPGTQGLSAADGLAQPAPAVERQRHSNSCFEQLVLANTSFCGTGSGMNMNTCVPWRERACGL